MQTHGNNGSDQSYGRAGAKSMPASRRTSASSNDEGLADHLQCLSVADPPVVNQDQVLPSVPTTYCHHQSTLFSLNILHLDITCAL